MLPVMLRCSLSKVVSSAPKNFAYRAISGEFVDRSSAAVGGDGNSDMDDFDVIHTKIETLAKATYSVRRLVGEHAKDLRSARTVITLLGDKVISQDGKIKIQDGKIKILNQKVDSQDGTIKIQDGKIKILTLKMDSLLVEKVHKRKELVVRQLASAYQFRAATVAHHQNPPNRRFMVTHDQLLQSKNTDKALLAQLEANFAARDIFLTGAAIEGDISQIRTVGVGTSHPNMLMDAEGNEFVPSEADLRAVVAELCSDGTVASVLQPCAEALIDNIVALQRHPDVQILVGGDLLKNSP